jgi:VanZ family protein
LTNNDPQWRAGFVAYAPLIFWIALILFFSGSRGSVDETSGFFRPLIEYFFPSLTPEEIIFYYGYVRKFLHFAVYAVLGFLAVRAFSPYFRDRPSVRTVLIALLICFAVAITDEYIQSLDPSRTGTLYDVAIDMAGATVAVITMWLISPSVATKEV